MNKLQISYIKENEVASNKFMSILKGVGYDVIFSNEEIDENRVGLLIFYKGASKEKMLKEIKWLAKQNERSSIRYLRLFPIFLFDKEEDIEKDIDSYVDAFDDFISGEFKPYGFVLSKPNKYIVEFNKILEESYSE